MTASYRHTQFAAVPAILLSILLLTVLAILLVVAAPPAALLLIVLLDLALILIFTRLTTRVTDRAFEHCFGLGVWRKSYPLPDLADVAVVRNRWWYGFGIRLTPHGWLYNVWGLDAIQVTLTRGRTLRVGTDEPRALVAALERAGVTVKA